MVTKHELTYYTNKYHNQFNTESAALADEELRDYCPFKIKTLNNGETFSWGESIEGIDDYGKPYTGQPNDKNKVFLLKDIIIKCEDLILTHGENVGICRQHHGCGTMAEVLVILEENK